MTTTLRTTLCYGCHCRGLACYCDCAAHEHIVDERGQRVAHYVTTCDDPDECLRPMHYARACAREEA